MKILGVIPARYASSRFPGKPLADIGGKSMIRRVYEQAQIAANLDQLIVATDDSRIYEHVKSWGGLVEMTSSHHLSGTDRCHEILQKQKDKFDVIVNIQGDEPFIDPAQIEKVTESFINKGTQICSLAKKISNSEELFSPNSVKVVIGENKKALYFSRAVIPFLRGIEEEDYLKKASFYKHLGIYAFRSTVLAEISQLPTSDLEKAESLEQLRWLSAGFQINMEITEKEGTAIDSPEDLLKLTNKI